MYNILASLLGKESFLKKHIDSVPSMKKTSLRKERLNLPFYDTDPEKLFYMKLLAAQLNSQPTLAIHLYNLTLFLSEYKHN